MSKRAELEKKAFELIKQLTPEQLEKALRAALETDRKEDAQNG